MNNDEFEKRMRALEHFHSLRLPPGVWTVLRVDGRSFTRFTETGFEKPIDTGFQQMMRQTAQALLEELHGVYAYTESDEIPVLFDPGWDLFDRELEKLVSISAAIASATFTHASQRIVHFDSRVWLGNNPSQVVDYFRWRQTDAERCALNGWCYWTLRKLNASGLILRNHGRQTSLKPVARPKEADSHSAPFPWKHIGKKSGEATALLKNKLPDDKIELLSQHGISCHPTAAKTPGCRHRGSWQGPASIA